jgi:predicted transcriptional regulator
LEATVRNDVIILKPKAVVDRESVEAAIEEGLADLKAGRVSPTFSNVKEFKKSPKAKR